MLYWKPVGKLENLEKKLYEENTEEISRRMRRRVVFPKSLQKLSSMWSAPTEPAPGVLSPERKKKAAKIIFGAAGFVFIVLAAAFLFLFIGNRGQEAKISIHDRGPIEAGEILTIPIVYKNTANTKLAEVELTILLPAGSAISEGEIERLAPPRITKKIKDLAPGEEGKTEITARLFGHEGEGKEVEAILLYRPENLRARFSSKTSKTFKINRVPLALSWELSETLAHGQEVLSKIRYVSNSSRVFQNMWLRIEYPPGFLFRSGNPNPEVGESIWNLGNLEPGKEGSIEIRGTISGEEGETKAFRSELGIFNTLTKEWTSYRDSAASVKIASAPLSIQTFLNGSRSGIITPGQQLNFVLRYKNNTELPLKNITAKVLLEGSILEFSSLEISQGVFDAATRSIVWNSATRSDLKEVAPGSAGELLFSIKTKERPIVISELDKNQIVKVRSEIKPGQTPAEFSGTDLSSRDQSEYRVASKVVFTGKVLYRSSSIVNSGPLPPKVGAKTTYTISWELRNFSNDLQNAEVRGTIPPNIKWENAILPKDARVTYDVSSGQVLWRPGEIKAGAGILTPAFTLAFQVSVTPHETDIGKELTLILDPQFTATDVFAGKTIEEKANSLQNLPEGEKTLDSARVVR